MKPLLSTLVLLVACNKSGATKNTTSFQMTITGTIQNILGAPGANAVTTTTFSGLCTGPPVLKVDVFDLEQLIAGGAALATCNTDPATGDFSCTSTDLASAQTLVAFVNDVDDTTNDCVASTLGIPLDCSPDADCTGVAKANAGTIHIGTTANTAPLVVFPAKVVTAFNSQLQAINDPTYPTLQGLTDSGAIISIVVDANGEPVGDALPYLPHLCRTAEASVPQATCATWIVNLDANGNPILDTSTKLTAKGIGIFITQSLGLTFNTSDTESYGAVDCSNAATPTCFNAVSAGTVGKGQAGPTAWLSLNYILASPSTGGSCKLVGDASANGDAATVQCP